MKAFEKGNTVSMVGTWLQGYFTCAFADLVRILGAPSSDAWASPTDGDGKVSTEWTVRADDGRVFTVYDYKETSLYDSDLPSVDAFRAQPSHRWHIGGSTSCADFVAWLQSKIATGGT